MALVVVLPSCRKKPIIVWISLRTGCAVTARRYAVQLQAKMEGLRAMKHFQIGHDGLGRLYKAVAEQALDRIIGERLGHPSPFHDRIDFAHARMFALSPTCGEVPSRSLAVAALQAAGVDHQEILEVIETIDAYQNRCLVPDGQLAVQLKAAGYPITAENLARARPTATAAMAQACLSAMSGDKAEPARTLAVPVPPSMAQFGSLLPHAAQPAAAAPVSTAKLEPDGVANDVRDGPFSVAAEVVIRRRLDEELWDEERAQEIRASIHLFIEASSASNAQFGSHARRRTAARRTIHYASSASTAF